MYTKYDQSSEDWGLHWHIALCRNRMIAHGIGVTLYVQNETLVKKIKIKMKCRVELWGWDVMQAQRVVELNSVATEHTEDLQQDLVLQTTGLKRLVWAPALPGKGLGPEIGMCCTQQQQMTNADWQPCFCLCPDSLGLKQLFAGDMPRLVCLSKCTCVIWKKHD